MARILVIDDDDKVRRWLAKLLMLDGHDVVEVYDREQGMRFLKNAESDVVITDIFMPNKEGVESIAELRQDFPEVKIIAMSGGGLLKADEYLRQAKVHGAHRTLKKPLEPECCRQFKNSCNNLA